jgi:hypothetical protein
LQADKGIVLVGVVSWQQIPKGEEVRLARVVCEPPTDFRPHTAEHFRVAR